MTHPSEALPATEVMDAVHEHDPTGPLRDAGADVVMHERPGSHGGAFWQEEFPLMVAWAFGP